MKTGSKKHLFLLFVSFGLVSIANGFLNINFGLLFDFALETNFKGMIAVAQPTLIIVLGLMVSLMISNLLEKEYLQTTMVDVKSNYMSTLLKRHRLSETTSTYVSHLSNDADRLEKQYYQSLLTLLKFIVKILIAAVILAQYSVHFITVILILTIIFFLTARKTSEPVRKEEEGKSATLQSYTHFVKESLDGFSVIKSHQIEDKREQAFVGEIENLKKQHYKVEKQKSIVDALNETLQAIIIGILIIGFLFAGKQLGVSVGSNIAVTLLFSDILWPLQRVTPLITEIFSIKSILDDYDSVLNKPEDSGQQSISSFTSLKFTNASLGYDGAILDDVNLSINKGERVLIIGPSGAGKSTILKTLQRDIDVLKGCVSMNAKPIKEYALGAYYQLLTIVDQIGFIFFGTIQENISMLRNKDVTSYLKEASLNYLNQNTLLINNGDNLSGGERARLLLARALYFNKELIICDEILSSLDSNIAQAIEKDIIDHASTLINVSHIVFVENLQYYDKFVIVDHGKVLVTTDESKVLERMMDTDIEFM